MIVVPCALCGYDSATPPPGGPAEGCAHCGHAPLDESLALPRPGPWGGVAIGLAAIPRGLHYLATTHGVKRWIIPPLVITLTAFGALFWWLWTLFGRLTEWLAQGREQPLAVEPEWLQRPLEWLLGLRVFIWLGQAAGAVVALATFALAAFWAFSIVYEAVSGPFLDEIHGRIEARWFGRNPRNALYRPVTLSSADCTRHSAIAALLGLACGALWWALGGPRPLLALAGLLPAAFVLVGLVRREFGAWLWWVLRVEGGTLYVSLKAALVAGLFLVLFFWLKFVPFVGLLLFGIVAGFTTAVSLMDIPCERRQWTFTQRMAFLFRNAPAVVAFGAVASLLFVVPVIGPVLMVPAASVGGLWMLCRLDKDFLLPLDRRAARRGPPAAAASE